MELIKANKNQLGKFEFFKTTIDGELSKTDKADLIRICKKAIKNAGLKPKLIHTLDLEMCLGFMMVKEPTFCFKCKKVEVQDYDVEVDGKKYCYNCYGGYRE